MAGPGTSEPNVERQQTAEEQRILAQRQREREENDAAWLRYVESLEPEIRAVQAARRLKCQEGNFCTETLLSPTPPPTAEVDIINEGLFSRIIVNSGGNAIIEREGITSEDIVRNRTVLSSGLAFVYGNLDGQQSAEYLVFGTWAHTADAENRGAFAVGAEFSADLPATGTAEYRGVGVASSSARDDDYYGLTTLLNVNFAADNAHTMSGTLTESSVGGATFTLDLEESTFRQGEFADGAVTCGDGMCEYDAGGSGLYNAKFFGTVGSDDNPTKLGGTFRATGLSLEGKDAATVLGAFGGELQ